MRQEKRPGRFADGNGLYLHISDTGARWWVWRGVIRGKRSERGLGSVQIYSLAEAREIARKWRRIAKEGGDPGVVRDKAKRRALTFEEATQKAWAALIEPHAKSAKHRRQWLTTLRDYAFPVIGTLPVDAVEQSDVLRVLSPIWTEKPETARRVRQRLRTVLNWAKTAGHREGVNPVEGVGDGLPKRRMKVRHFRALPYSELPEVMRRIEAMDGMGALALQFTILTAGRSGEVRGAMWSEIDIQGRLWTIPEDRMKADEAHRVPLSDAALAVLERVRGLSPRLVFPSNRNNRPLSDMTLAAVLKRLKVDATVHGFRSTFRDWAEERTSFSREVKEAALAHTVKDKTEASYRRGDLLEMRRDLMERWTRFCCPAVADVIEIGHAG